MASSKETLARMEQFSLDADRAFLDRPADRPIERPLLPPLQWPAEAGAEAQLEAACHWLIACAVRPAPGEVRRPMRWMPATQTPSEADCLGTSVVQAIGSELTLHYAFDDDRRVRLEHQRLNGLFGFLRAIVWPMWVNESCGRRLRVEPVLAPPQQEAADRYRAAEAQEHESIRRRLRRSRSLWNLGGLFGSARLQEHERFRGQAQQLQAAACSFYAEEFRQFALSPPVRALDDGLFAPFRLPDARPYEALVDQLASTREALPLSRQVAGPTRWRNHPDADLRDPARTLLECLF